MNTPHDIHATMRDTFGFDAFRDGQEDVINRLLQGRSTLAVFPTGSGKSLCYQLPAVLLDGVTLVVSPLIALMKDQIDFLTAKQIPAARLDSTVSSHETAACWHAIHKGTLKLLYIAPERFANEHFVKQLRSVDISLMVIDEAHCMSEWGHNFRPDYLKLARIAKDFRVPRVLTLTATATPRVAEQIREEFGIAADDYINTGFHRPNLELHATSCDPPKRDDLLLLRLRTRPAGPTIVYVTKRQTAEEVAIRLADAGFAAQAYHAGLPSETRHEVQDWFMQSADGIVVATIAFGMGIDKSDIRYVYHYNLPKGPENYAQEIGRAGRDGLPSICEVLACEEDVDTLESFALNRTPNSGAVTGLLHDILSNGETFDVSVYELAKRFNMEALTINTLLCYLELLDIIKATGTFYAEHQFRFVTPRHRVMASLPAKCTTFLQSLIDHARAGRVWMHINLTQVVGTNGRRERAIAALTWLQEQGHIVVKPSGPRQVYRIVSFPGNIANLAQGLMRRFLAAEKRDLARVRRMVELTMADGCLVRRTLSYFGEELGRDCGHCGWCLGEPSGTTQGRHAAMRTRRDWKAAGESIHRRQRRFALDRLMAEIRDPDTLDHVAALWGV